MEEPYRKLETTSIDRNGIGKIESMIFFFDTDNW